MTNGKRHRVTGAVFLIAVAVIVLPMLFDGAGLETEPMSPLEMDEMEPVVIDAPVLDTEAIAEADAMRRRLDDEAFERATGQREGDPRLSDADSVSHAVVEAWAVQIASFSDRDKAVALRERLLKDGHAAFLSDVKRVSGVSTRVAVGPIKRRADAESLQVELAKRYAADAIVVRFEP